MALLILVRHGESEYNEKGLWTGWTDVDLTEKGRQQARTAAGTIATIKIDFAFTSVLKRAIHTWEEIENVIHQSPPTEKSDALNERNYGIYTGKNKWEIKNEVGEEEFIKIRRSWDYPPPQGESLKMVYDRVYPYYTQHILHHLKDGKNAIVVAHGNSLRALIKYLDNVSDTDIANVELSFSEPVVYTVNEEGNIVDKEIRKTGTVME